MPSKEHSKDPEFDLQTILLLPGDVVQRRGIRGTEVIDERFGVVVQVGPYRKTDGSIDLTAKINWQTLPGETLTPPTTRYPVTEAGTCFRINNNAYFGDIIRRIRVVGVIDDPPFCHLNFPPEEIDQCDID